MGDGLWVFLAASPLFWLTLTIGVFLLASRLAKASGNHPLVNPVLISVGVLVAILRLTGTDYLEYFDGAQFIHFILGPATVALAIPLWRHRARVRELAVPILAALFVGAPFAMFSAVLIAKALGLPETLQMALVPKSATAGIAVGVAEQIGVNGSLVAVFVIVTGIIGAVIVTPLMNAMGIRDYAARGFAAGLSAHGIGTARAFQVDPLAGAFSGLAMALNGIATAILAGWLFS
ncbi:LrgB family protein [Pelagibacterium nitratireducens]|uniref:LrgB family protein n=1 Tax=Pelagibacterium nitratireducens TaxID=1046114 RepID=A0ABZ2HZA0_9HYPH